MPKGSCLCGAVGVEVMGDLAAPAACHCSQCRKHSGHYWAATEVPTDRLTITGEENVGWYQSSEKVRRGFCKICGSTLFWDPSTRDHVSVSMGIFDGDTQARMNLHIFPDDKGDYYDIADGLPQNGQ